jgi:hypothetical protein
MSMQFSVDVVHQAIGKDRSRSFSAPQPFRRGPHVGTGLSFDSANQGHYRTTKQRGAVSVGAISLLAATPATFSVLEGVFHSLEQT